MEKLPPEAERLLAAAPEDFVAERGRVARALREDGRKDEAEVVAGLRKPSLVVLAVNRAARDRPRPAQDAAKAAERVRAAQLSGEASAYRDASKELETALSLLAEVALARLSRSKPATDAMRRRVNDVLRAAVADEETRDALARGALVDEPAPRGFEAFAGVELPARPRRRGREERPAQRETARKAREKELRDEIARARDALKEAEKRVRDAERERERAAKALAALEAKLERG